MTPTSFQFLRSVKFEYCGWAAWVPKRQTRLRELVKTPDWV